MPRPDLSRSFLVRYAKAHALACRGATEGERRAAVAAMGRLAQPYLARADMSPERATLAPVPQLCRVQGQDGLALYLNGSHVGVQLEGEWVVHEWPLEMVGLL
jgi:hypothetical protein